LDSPPPKTGVRDYLLSENRFKMLTMSKPEAARQLFAQAQADAESRRRFYQFMQSRNLKGEAAAPATIKVSFHGEPPA